MTLLRTGATLLGTANAAQVALDRADSAYQDGALQYVDPQLAAARTFTDLLDRQFLTFTDELRDFGTLFPDSGAAGFANELDALNPVAAVPEASTSSLLALGLVSTFAARLRLAHRRRRAN